MLKLKVIKRKTSRGWKRVRLYDLRPGDEFIMEGHVYRAILSPYMRNGVWEIKAEAQ